MHDSILVPLPLICHVYVNCCHANVIGWFYYVLDE